MVFVKKMQRRGNATKKLYKKKRSNYANQAMSVMKMAKQAWYGVKLLKGLVNVEKNFLDGAGALTPGTTPAMYCINQCSQGGDDINRKGDSILMKHATITYSLTKDATSPGDLFRVMLVCDKENRGSAPALTDILDAGDTHGQTNRDNLDRFIVLADRKYALTASDNIKVDKIYMPLDIHGKYAGSAGTVADIRQNGLFLVMVGSDNTYKSVINFSHRIAFYDN